MNEWNWAGNHHYRAQALFSPQTVEELQEHVAHNSAIKGLGSRHSFNAIADTPGTLLSLRHLNRVISLDREQKTVTVEGGIRYGELSRFLHTEGFALHNLASLPHISVAGACATSTHGSGVSQGNLATAVSALELVVGNGERVSLSRQRNPETFPGAAAGLGALGIAAQLTLNLLPAFEMRQDVYENLSFAEFEAHADEILSGGYSVSLFTDWRERRFTQVWRKRKLAEAGSAAAEKIWFEAAAALRPLHPLPGLSAENCTQQLGVPGPSHKRLPHFRLEFTPSSGEELQSEYFVPRFQIVPALNAVAGLGEIIAPLLFISEIRTIARDDLWMSPCCERDCAAIHFTWKPEWPAVRTVLPKIEAALASFGACPHWGKLFTLPAAELRPLYPRLSDFRRLALQFDPLGKFQNDFLGSLFNTDH